MRTIFKELRELKGGALSEKKSTWFNGVGYFPLYSFSLTYNKEFWTFSLFGDLRTFPFSKPGKFMLNTGNIDSWHLELSNPKLPIDFWLHVEKTGFLSQILFNKPEYSLKSSNAQLVQWAKRTNFINQHLARMPFCPIQTIETKVKNGMPHIYSALTFHESAFDKILSALAFFEKLVEEINDNEFGVE